MPKLKTKMDFSAGGVVWNPTEKQMMLVRVKNLTGKEVWTLPKGHPEAKESDEEAALREVREETGWQCRVLKSMSDVHYWYVHRGVRFAKTVRWFLMAPVEKTGEFSPQEILDCRWFDLEEAAQAVTYPSDKDLLKELRKMI